MRTKLFKEREKHIYRLVNGLENKTSDFDQLKCIKDEEQEVLVQEKNIKDKQKKYFRKLFREGYEILSDANRLNIRQEDRN